MTVECSHTQVLWHTPKRNHKQCVACDFVLEMTQAECWRHRESFEDPWLKLYGEAP